MTTGELLELLRHHAPELRTSLTLEQRCELAGLLRGLREAGSDERATRRLLLTVRRHLLLTLPATSEVRRTLSADVRSGLAPVALPDVDQLATVIALLDTVDWPAVPWTGPGGSDRPEDAREQAEEPPTTEEIVASVHRRLLAVPARGTEQLPPAIAGDPLGAGLIRLTDAMGNERYPDFQFDPETDLPRPLVQRINRLLRAADDPWGVADWWMGGSVWLNGPPADQLGRASDDLLYAAAHALVEDRTW